MTTWELHRADAIRLLVLALGAVVLSVGPALGGRAEAASSPTTVTSPSVVEPQPEAAHADGPAEPSIGVVWPHGCRPA
jgi:hypothetical protein